MNTTIDLAELRQSWQGWLALVLLAAAAFVPMASGVLNPESPNEMGLLGPVPIGWVAIVGALAITGMMGRATGAIIALALGSAVGAAYLIAVLPVMGGQAAAGYWLFLLACWLLGWLLVERLAALRPPARAAQIGLTILIPLIVGIWLLVLWETVVRGAGVLPVILPPPSAIWARIVNSVPILAGDFLQTFKGVAAGYVVGSAAGFLAAIAADRVPFLRRGLLPIGNLVSALPIVGIAPIMVMWFGFDWQSKAAVVVVMTFFPMLVNTVAGLSAAGAMERDLMRTYAAGYWTSFVKLRLPAALPFIFNALKINSTLALIGAIVAEFFGTPIQGMGFRISAAVGRLDIDLVWAEIAVAAVAGTALYGLVALIERASTFWHPSIRT